MNVLDHCRNTVERFSLAKPLMLLLFRPRQFSRYSAQHDFASNVLNDVQWQQKNDPNDWATEHNDPQYILNLVKRVVRVSVEKVRIVAELPALQDFQAGSTLRGSHGLLGTVSTL